MSEERVVSFLKSRGAAEIPHLGGSLLDHSVGTRDLLREWGNPAHICDAGLCHAVYGTFGFPTALLQISERQTLVDLIGRDAERLVYFYVSCDRDHVHPRIGRTEPVEFHDRFTGAFFVPEPALLAPFMEITFANEFELAEKHPDSAKNMCAALGELFERSRGLVSESAFSYFNRLCGAHA